MPSGDLMLRPPAIYALKTSKFSLPIDVILVDTYVKIHTEIPNCRLFFTTDGTDPLPEGRTENTHPYSAPFKLRPGKRTVKAIAVNRLTGEWSAITSKTFEVIEDSTSSGSPFSESEEVSVISEISTSSSISGMAYPRKHPYESRSSMTRSPERLPRIDDYFEAAYRPNPYARSTSPSQRYYDSDDDVTVASNYFSTRATQHRIDNLQNLRHHPKPPPAYTAQKRFYEDESEHMLQDLDRRYAAEKQRRSRDYSRRETDRERSYRASPPRGHGDPFLGGSVRGQRVRFAEREQERLNARLDEDMRRRDILAEITGNEPRYFGENQSVLEPAVDRRSRSPSPPIPLDPAGVHRANAADLVASKFSLPASPPQRDSRLSDLGYRLGESYAAARTREEKEEESLTDCTTTLSELEKEYATLYQRPRSPPRQRSRSRSPEKEEGNSRRESRWERFERESARSDSGDRRKERKDEANLKQKEEKEKKKKTSSSSSLSSSSENEKDKKKEKKEKKKSKPVVESEKTKEESPVPPPLSAASYPLAFDQVPRVPLPPPGKPHSADPALQFSNDSGTQINFWGAPPPEVLDKMTGMFPSVRRNLSECAPSERDISQLTAPKEAKASAAAPIAKTQLTAPKEAKARAAAPIVKTQQAEQESFFDGLFKSGWGSSEKEAKQRDPRSTVNVVGEEADAQGYAKLLSKCQNKKQLFEDPDFECNDEAIYFQNKPVRGEVEWKRPGEICSSPQMFVGGASRFDVMQGVLGNCWLLASVASLASDQKLLNRVVPQDQGFDKGYCGLFRFYLWQYGQWYEVCIDDRLPTYRGKLIYMHSQSGNEFWSPLLEKAYAKLAGCYESLSGGLQAEAMTDFTGGVCERYNFREELPSNMFQIMHKARKRGALMGCSIDATPNTQEEQLPNGLVIGHAYSVTGVTQLSSGRGVVQLVRCRNPWGTEHEWKGAWSDKSSEWQGISEEERQRLGLRFDHDGEFWMSFKDFSANFQRLEICNLGPDDVRDDWDDDVTWQCQLLTSAWKKNVNAGGCRNFPKTFSSNPQYRVELRDVDDDDDEDTCTLIVALMQKGRRRLRKLGANLTMGFEIYDVDGEGGGNLTRKFFGKHGPTASSPQYINMREIVGRYKLPPGEYCIIPTTYEANEEADFIIRVFTEKESGNLIEADETTCVVKATPATLVHSAAHASQTTEAEEKFKQFGGEDEEVDASELQSILNEIFTKDFDFGGFDINLSRSLLATQDRDKTGKLDLEEFKLLWEDLMQWKLLFKQRDEDKTGCFNSMELREALESCNYKVSNAALRNLSLRHSDKSGVIRFDDFVTCLVKVKSLCDIHSRASSGDSRTANFTLDQFIQTAACI